MFFRTALTRANRRRADRGFTLVELMVALTIGLLLVLVVTQAYLSGISTQRAQSDVGRLQEAARFAFDAFSQGARKAGYRNPLMLTAQPFCDPAVTPPARLAGTNDPTTSYSDPSGTNFAILNGSDIVRFRYYGDGMTVSPFTADSSILDCLGNAVAANVLAEDTLFVAADTTNNSEPTLFCNSTNPASAASGSVPMIPGIESVQILYGDNPSVTTGTTIPTGTVERYVPAGQVSNMNNVRTLMVSVVARTPTPVATDRTTARTFNHFGAGYAAGDVAPAGDPGSVFSPVTDGRIRQQSNTIVAFRNLCPTY